MLNISELHMASILMDIAALLLLIGTTIHTTIYRKRGKVDDRLFFILIIITAVMSISDAITYILDGGRVPGGVITSILCNNIYFITFELFCGVLAVYLDYRAYAGHHSPVRSAVIMLLSVAMTALIILNNSGRFLYWVDPVTNQYYQYPMYSIIFFGPALYAILGLFYIIKIDARVSWMYILLILIRLMFGQLTRGVSSTALIFAIGLAFIHIHYMRLPFYDEEVL